jgi:hypothetical protein
MYFKQYLDERCGCASYLVASRQSNEAAIVDPSLATEQYEELLAQRAGPGRRARRGALLARGGDGDVPVPAAARR